jgi:ribosome-binding protein aMBF1 (putative translation factor)
MIKTTADAGKVPVSSNLGSRIRTARRDAGLSQGQLASALNTTRNPYDARLQARAGGVNGTWSR